MTTKLSMSSLPKTIVVKQISFILHRQSKLVGEIRARAYNSGSMTMTIRLRGMKKPRNRLKLSMLSSIGQKSILSIVTVSEFKRISNVIDYS